MISEHDLREQMARLGKQAALRLEIEAVQRFCRWLASINQADAATVVDAIACDGMPERVAQILREIPASEPDDDDQTAVRPGPRLELVAGATDDQIRALVDQATDRVLRGADLAIATPHGPVIVRHVGVSVQIAAPDGRVLSADVTKIDGGNLSFLLASVLVPPA